MHLRSRKANVEAEATAGEEPSLEQEPEPVLDKPVPERVVVTNGALPSTEEEAIKAVDDACFDSSTVAAPIKSAGQLLHTLFAGRPGETCAFNVGGKLTVFYSLSEAIEVLDDPEVCGCPAACVAR